jgi:hypothetical protein
MNLSSLAPFDAPEAAERKLMELEAHCRTPRFQTVASIPPSMSWSLEFVEAIALANGKPLRTLRDAVHRARVPFDLRAKNATA